MENWILIVIGVICILVEIFCRAFLDNKSKKFPGGSSGLIFVDDEGDGRCGVYCQFFVEPQTLENGKFILMEVQRIELKSQQNQDL